MTPLPPTSTLFPYTTLFRSLFHLERSVRVVIPREGQLQVAAVEVHGQKGGNDAADGEGQDRKSTRLNSSHLGISYAVYCLKKKNKAKKTKEQIQPQH